MSNIRVLMINRADAETVPGGDVVQLDKTRAALEKLGVIVDVRLANQLQVQWDYDLVHLFNVQSIQDSWLAFQVAKEHNLPVVLSTIYWDFLPSWYWMHPNLNPLWQFLRNRTGRWGYPIYATWQRLRYPSSSLWQKQRHLLLSVDRLLPNSKMEAVQLSHDFRLTKQKTLYSVVPNGIDAQLFTDSAQPDSEWLAWLNGKNLVLQIGRLSPEKNQLALLEALWDLEVAIAFVGKASPYDPEYAELCKERGRQRGNVRFVEWMPYEQLPSMYAAATVHVLPSWRETPGLVSLEAAAVGCRIVSTAIGSAYEYLGEEAWYCDPSSPKSIRRAVQKALTAKSSNRLKQRIVSEFTWEAAAKATLKAYKQVLGIAV